MNAWSVAVLWFGSMLMIQSAAGYSGEHPELLFLTEHSPPGQYLDQSGQVAGVTVELIQQLKQRVGQSGSIELLPWARAFEIANTHPSIALFETARTTEREKLFQWVGPLKYVQTSLYGRADRFEHHDKNVRLNPNLIACEYRSSLHVSRLQQYGFEEGRNLVLTLSHGDCFQMLILERVDLIVLHDAAVTERQQQLQASNQTDLVKLQPIREVELYLAFSRDISSEQVAIWQQALAQSYLDGTMRGLYQGIYAESMLERLEQWAEQVVGN
ncbi:ABC transporter substrate-binding protein [Alkalimonas collagenimarina]|uniref:ABC transporter substrate-binding protein n=1 Tax=Alkalimonas collagenimarina TaxID=400390 RepID=A0ABT9GYL4_9GAMM|nr:ABC transporter substrate-binding protein [Alkalimonas collagenimarina]MDP4536148.1 ABC transporter substrate-binding protein [Alkalimonas collagenimarina]